MSRRGELLLIGMVMACQAPAPEVTSIYATDVAFRFVIASETILIADASGLFELGAGGEPRGVLTTAPVRRLAAGHGWTAWAAPPADLRQTVTRRDPAGQLEQLELDVDPTNAVRGLYALPDGILIVAGSVYRWRQGAPEALALPANLERLVVADGWLYALEFDPASSLAEAIVRFDLDRTERQLLVTLDRHELASRIAVAGDQLVYARAVRGTPKRVSVRSLDLTSLQLTDLGEFDDEEPEALGLTSDAVFVNGYRHRAGAWERYLPFDPGRVLALEVVGSELYWIWDRSNRTERRELLRTSTEGGPLISGTSGDDRRPPFL